MDLTANARFWIVKTLIFLTIVNTVSLMSSNRPSSTRAYRKLVVDTITDSGQEVRSEIPIEHRSLTVTRSQLFKQPKASSKMRAKLNAKFHQNAIDFREKLKQMSNPEHQKIVRRLTLRAMRRIRHRRSRPSRSLDDEVVEEERTTFEHEPFDEETAVLLGKRFRSGYKGKQRDKKNSQEDLDSNHYTLYNFELKKESADENVIHGQRFQADFFYKYNIHHYDVNLDINKNRLISIQTDLERCFNEAKSKISEKIDSILITDKNDNKKDCHNEFKHFLLRMINTEKFSRHLIYTQILSDNNVMKLMNIIEGYSSSGNIDFDKFFLPLSAFLEAYIQNPDMFDLLTFTLDYYPNGQAIGKLSDPDGLIKNADDDSIQNGSSTSAQQSDQTLTNDPAKVVQANGNSTGADNNNQSALNSKNSSTAKDANFDEKKKFEQTGASTKAGKLVKSKPFLDFEIINFFAVMWGYEDVVHILRQLSAYSDFLRQFTIEIEKVYSSKADGSLDRDSRFESVLDSEKFSDLLTNSPENYNLYLMTTISRYFLENSEQVNSNYLLNKNIISKITNDEKESRSISLNQQETGKQDKSGTNVKESDTINFDIPSDQSSTHREKLILEKIDFEKFKTIVKAVTSHMEELPKLETNEKNNAQKLKEEAETASKKDEKNANELNRENEIIESEDLTKLQQKESRDSEKEQSKEKNDSSKNSVDKSSSQTSEANENSQDARELLAIISDF